jgi:hypothetical protein
MKELNLTSEGFEIFLNWLDLDREAAGQRYEAIRRRLSAFFGHGNDSGPNSPPL